MKCGVLSSFLLAVCVTWMGRSRAGAVNIQPRQPWLLFQERISCCLATTQTWWVFVYSSSCAKLSSDPKLLHSTMIAFNIRAATDGSESAFAFNSSFFKVVFVKYTHTTPNKFNSRLIRNTFQYVNGYFS